MVGQALPPGMRREGPRYSISHVKEQVLPYIALNPLLPEGVNPIIRPSLDEGLQSSSTPHRGRTTRFMAGKIPMAARNMSLYSPSRASTPAQLHAK